MDDRCEESFWEGYAGDDLAIPFQLIDENGVPEKIGEGDGVTDIIAQFTNVDGELVQLKLSDESPGITVVDSTCGRGQITVPSATSATLPTSKVKRQNFAIAVLKNGLQRTWGFEASLLLKPRPAPASS